MEGIGYPEDFYAEEARAARRPSADEEKDHRRAMAKIFGIAPNVNDEERKLMEEFWGLVHQMPTGDDDRAEAILVRFSDVRQSILRSVSSEEHRILTKQLKEIVDDMKKIPCSEKPMKHKVSDVLSRNRSPGFSSSERMASFCEP